MSFVPQGCHLLRLFVSGLGVALMRWMLCPLLLCLFAPLVLCTSPLRSPPAPAFCERYRLSFAVEPVCFEMIGRLPLSRCEGKTRQNMFAVPCLDSLTCLMGSTCLAPFSPFFVFFFFFSSLFLLFLVFLFLCAFSFSPFPFSVPLSFVLSLLRCFFPLPFPPFPPFSFLSLFFFSSWLSWLYGFGLLAAASPLRFSHL